MYAENGEGGLPASAVKVSFLCLGLWIGLHVIEMQRIGWSVASELQQNREICGIAVRL